MAFLPDGYPLLKSIEIKGNILESDKFGCGYVISDYTQVTKLCPDSSGKKIYSELSYGNITSIDPKNPFKILVFYKDFATIVLLDNTLSELGTVNLRNINILQPAAICLATDGNTWVYDEQEFKLKKVNDSGQLLYQSEDFTILFPEPSHPDFMTEMDNTLYVNDPQNGIRVFDIYGAYAKTIPIKGLKRFQIVNNQIIYFKDGKLFSFHTMTFDTKQVQLPAGINPIDANAQSAVLLLLSDSLLNLYSYK